MERDYPDDADGDALRRMAAEGWDMARPMAIDFFVAAPTEEAGEQIAELAMLAGYSTHLEYDDEIDDEEDNQLEPWTCYCTKLMVPTYAAIIVAQRELDDLSSPFGGRSDGWGTAGPAD